MVLCVFLQAETSNSVETAAKDIHFPVEVTGGNMRPVVKLKKLDIARYLVLFIIFLFVDTV